MFASIHTVDGLRGISGSLNVVADWLRDNADQVIIDTEYVDYYAEQIEYGEADPYAVAADLEGLVLRYL